jgi:hypothetical protein
LLALPLSNTTRKQAHTPTPTTCRVRQRCVALHPSTTSSHGAQRCNSLSACLQSLSEVSHHMCRSCACEFAPHARYTVPSSRQSELLWQMNYGHAVQRHTGPQVHDMLCSLFDTCIQNVNCCFVSLTLKGNRVDRAHISRTHTNLPRVRIAVVLLHPQRSTPATRRQEAIVLSAHVVSPLSCVPRTAWVLM